MTREQGDFSRMRRKLSRQRETDRLKKKAVDARRSSIGPPDGLIRLSTHLIRTQAVLGAIPLVETKKTPATAIEAPQVSRKAGIMGFKWGRPVKTPRKAGNRRNGPGCGARVPSHRESDYATARHPTGVSQCLTDQKVSGSPTACWFFARQA